MSALLVWERKVDYREETSGLRLRPVGGLKHRPMNPEKEYINELASPAFA